MRCSLQVVEEEASTLWKERNDLANLKWTIDLRIENSNLLIAADSLFLLVHREETPVLSH